MRTALHDCGGIGKLPEAESCSHLINPTGYGLLSTVYCALTTLSLRLCRGEGALIPDVIFALISLFIGTSNSAIV